MTVYAINYYDETDSHPRLNSYDLFKTEEIATNRLRRYAEEIKAGKWYDCAFLEWHDADESEVTWMRYSRKNPDGTASMMCLSIEECPVFTK